MVRIHHFGVVPSRHYFLADNGERVESFDSPIDPFSAIEDGLEIVLLYVLIAEGTPIRVIKAASFSSPFSPSEFIEGAWASEPLLRGLPDQLVISQKLYAKLPLLKAQMEQHGVAIEMVTGQDKMHSGLLVGAERQVNPNALYSPFATFKSSAAAIGELNAGLARNFRLRGLMAQEDWNLRDYFALEIREPQFKTMPIPTEFQPGSWLLPSTTTRSRPLTDEEVRGAEDIESVLDGLTRLGKSEFPWDIEKRHGDSLQGRRAAQDEIVKTLTPFAVHFYEEFKAELEQIVALHRQLWEGGQIQLFCDPHMVPHVSIAVGEMGQFVPRRFFDGELLPPSMTEIDDTWLLQRALPAPAVNSIDEHWLLEVGFEISAWGWKDVGELLIKIPIISHRDGDELRMALQSSRAGDIQNLMRKAKLTVYCDAKLKGYVAKTAWDVMLRCLAIHPDGKQAPHERFDLQRRIGRWKIDRREVTRTIEIVADLVLAIRSGAREVRAASQRDKADQIH